MLDLTDLNALFSLENPGPPPGVSPAPSASALQFLEQLHKHNTDMLKGVLAEKGWPLASEVGPNGASAAFIIALHSDYDPDFQRLCHGLMLDAARRGELDLGFVAFITDRILSNTGKYQRFGTQIREVSNGCFVPKPIEDPDALDELREQVGLKESLSDYLQRINDGDFMLYRELLDHHAQDIEDTSSSKIIPFPVVPKPH